MPLAANDPGAQAIADILIILGIVAYWVPSMVAVGRRRQIPNVGSVIVINLFLGWTVVGWVVALAMAVRSRPAWQRQPGLEFVAPPGPRPRTEPPSADGYQ